MGYSTDLTDKQWEMIEHVFKSNNCMVILQTCLKVRQMGKGNGFIGWREPQRCWS